MSGVRDSTIQQYSQDGTLKGSLVPAVNITDLRGMAFKDDLIYAVAEADDEKAVVVINAASVTQTQYGGYDAVNSDENLSFSNDAFGQLVLADDAFYVSHGNDLRRNRYLHTHYRRRCQLR